MKKIIFLVAIFSGMMMMLQGCYTILDLPESDSAGYVTYIEFVPVIIIDPVPDTPPPTYNPPVYYINQPWVTTPETKERTNGNVNRNGNDNIRNDGNGRGDSGRDNDFVRNSSSQTTTYSSSNNNTSSNDRNSGNGRR